MKPFVHLHVHTEYSLLDGATRIDSLFDYCKENNMPAVAITDHGVMYGAYKFCKMAKENGIKPIIGCEFYICENMYEKTGKPGDFEHLVLLAKNDIGYTNLVQLDSAAFIDGYYYKPRIDYNLLKKHTEGLVCLSACLSGAVSKRLVKNDYEGAKAAAIELKSMFSDGDFYIEIQDHGIAEQKLINPLLLKLANEIGVKVVATNDVHYLKKQDSEMQDVLLCIQTGKMIDDPNRMKFDGSEFYLKNYDEMHKLFSYAESALETPFEIVEKCNVDIVKHDLIPNYLPSNGALPYDYLKMLTMDGLKIRYGNVTKEITERAEYELETIKNMGFIEYFLIVWDFINYAKSKGIPVGAGRGSGAGSIIAYAIGITNIDPLKFNLLFERFLNPERVSMPDFDIDFCYERRNEVIEYVINKYGSDKVSQIVTFGTMAAKGAIKDVGRVYGVPYNEVDKVSKMLPLKGEIWQFLGLNNPNSKGKKSSDVPIIRDLVEIYQNNESMKRVIDMAMRIQNMPRNTSMHAAGVVICKEKISDFVPLQRNGDDITTQFNMIEVEELGLLKMDFLGLRTLTDIDKAIKSVKKTVGVDIDFDKIGYGDKGTYDLISAGNTDAVFQLESAGFKSFMKNLKPDNLEEIIVGISLYRPGPMDSIPEYINNKENPDKIVYGHSLLKEILKVTHNCIVYQEQVMQIFQKVGGFSLGHADIVRRAMSKKKGDEMKRQKKYFIDGGIYIMKTPDGKEEKINVDGALKRGVSRTVAEQLFDQMEKFASYAFNKSHAACYAVLSYQTAYLKRYYPVQYITAILNNRIDKIEEVTKYISLLRMENIKILPPDINKSTAEFSVEGNAVRFGLGAIKNVGFNAVDSIVKERMANGNFTSLKDFIIRAESNSINKRMLENLIKGGAFDCFLYTRSQQLAVYDILTDRLQKDKKKKSSGQLSMFDLPDNKDMDIDKVEYPDISEYNSKQKLNYEKDVLGVYISGHPLQDYAQQFNAFDFNTSMLTYFSENSDEVMEGQDGGLQCCPITEGQNVSMGGIITAFYKKLTKKNQEMAFATVEDLYGEVELVFFPNEYAKLKKQISMGNLPEIYDGMMVKVKGQFQYKDNGAKILVNHIEEWTDDKKKSNDALKVEILNCNDSARRLYLNLKDENTDKLAGVKEILLKYPGNTEVRVVLDIVYKMPMRIFECMGLNSELANFIGEDNIKYK